MVTLDRILFQTLAFGTVNGGRDSDPSLEGDSIYTISVVAKFRFCFKFLQLTNNLVLTPIGGAEFGWQSNQGKCCRTTTKAWIIFYVEGFLFKTSHLLYKLGITLGDGFSFFLLLSFLRIARGKLYVRNLKFP